MFKKGDIVRVVSTGIIAYVLDVYSLRRELVLLNCETKKVFVCNISDVSPWTPEGGGGGAFPWTPSLTDNDIEYYLLRYEIYGRSSTISPQKIRAFDPRFYDISSKIYFICDIAINRSGQRECECFCE